MDGRLASSALQWLHSITLLRLKAKVNASFKSNLILLSAKQFLRIAVAWLWTDLKDSTKYPLISHSRLRHPHKGISRSHATPTYMTRRIWTCVLLIFIRTAGKLSACVGGKRQGWQARCLKPNMKSYHRAQYSNVEMQRVQCIACTIDNMFGGTKTYIQMYSNMHIRGPKFVCVIICDALGRRQYPRPNPSPSKQTLPTCKIAPSAPSTLSPQSVHAPTAPQTKPRHGFSKATSQRTWRHESINMQASTCKRIVFLWRHC